ncbi:MAG: hypothetical protein R3253_17020 [Longimicrobiales bacterium]|nr:hypothetical protein [Longimicrobiales bacterium]
MKNTTIRGLRALALSSLVLAAATPASAQSASEIIDRMLAEYEARTEGIDNYTLVQDFMGFQATSYFVKEMQDGRPVFKLQDVSAGGMDMDDAGPGTVDEIYAIGEDFKDNATYLGQETVDGYATHVLEISDLENTELGQQMGQDSEFRPISGRLFLDAENYMPRRMIFQGELENSEGVHSVTSTMDLQDYRDHQGLLVAHRTIMTVDGLGAAIDDEARAQFEEMERELANMPPAQREMVESMMADQLEQFRAMMAGDDEPMVVEVAVSDVRINAGPPGGG